MVLRNLFAGQQWRNRHREQTYGHRERVGEENRSGSSLLFQDPNTWRNILNGRGRFTNGEGNGTPLQYSCLENPMDGGAW